MHNKGVLIDQSSWIQWFALTPCYWVKHDWHWKV